jgi:hypothetical protein
MTLDDITDIAVGFDGVRQTTVDGLRQWRFRGRLVARQLDESHVVVRTEFEVRDALLNRHPETFSVPARFAKHMMVVASLDGDAGAIEDALEAAWALQRSGG